MSAIDQVPGWRAIEAAARRARARRPFEVDGSIVGSVALEHVELLRAWPQWIALREARVVLTAAAGEREAALATINAALHAGGAIRAWRDEPFGLFGADGMQLLARIERASARFWGSLTRGAHCNGYVAGADGRPARLWIARRSATKATDPGKLDNLVGGGVSLGQSPFETLVREGFEEAGLAPELMRRARAGSVLRLDCDIAEGRMVEHLHVFDLELPAGLTPRNQDGEVQSIECLPIEQAAALAAADSEMTVDAALVTLDFLLRHDLLPALPAAALQSRLAAAGLMLPATPFESAEGGAQAV